MPVPPGPAGHQLPPLQQSQTPVLRSARGTSRAAAPASGRGVGVAEGVSQCSDGGAGLGAQPPNLRDGMPDSAQPLGLGLSSSDLAVGLATFSVDSSTDEDEDVEAVVVQLPVPAEQPSLLRRPLPATAPQEGGTVLAFAPSTAGLLLPKRPSRRRRSHVIKLGDYVRAFTCLHWQMHTRARAICTRMPSSCLLRAHQLVTMSEPLEVVCCSALHAIQALASSAPPAKCYDALGVYGTLVRVHARSYRAWRTRCCAALCTQGTLREKGRQHLHYFVSGFG